MIDLARPRLQFADPYAGRHGVEEGFADRRGWPLAGPRVAVDEGFVERYRVR